MTDSRVERVVNRFLERFSGERLARLLSRLLRRNYNAGLERVERDLQLTVNVVPNEEAVKFLERYSFELVKGLREDMAGRLRSELVAALLNREGADRISERVARVLDVSAVRARAIARTESHRAYGMGGYHAAKQSGLRLKKYVYNPSPQSAICKELVKRRPIGLDEKWRYNGEEFFINPFHVNCRSRVLYVQDDGVEVKHKYIRRWRSGGRWRYEYPEDRARGGRSSSARGREIVKEAYARIPKHKLEELNRVKKAYARGQDTKGEFFVDGAYTPERRKEHERIKKQLLNPASRVPIGSGGKPRLVILAGLPGSGKSFAIKRKLEEKRYSVLDADEVKFNLPEYNGLNAALLHRESRDVVDMIREEALDKGYNLILDGTARNYEKMRSIVLKAKKKGYEVVLASTKISPEQSVKNAEWRFFEKGRFVPYENIFDNYPAVEASIGRLKRIVDGHVRFDTEDVHNPVLIEQGGVKIV